MPYAKRYAVVVKVESPPRAARVLVAQYEDGGGTVRLSTRSRLGYGHCGSNPRFFDFDPGTRIKVFQRPGDRSPHFRRTGS